MKKLVINYINKNGEYVKPDILTIVELLKILRMSCESLHFYCLDDVSIVIVNHYDLFIKVAPVRVSEVKEYEN